MVKRQELFKNLATFKPPKVGAPDNRQGGSIRAFKAPNNQQGELK
ncbi:hypothetical protein [Dendronalium phyllosphericum]|nr:hypothetical protein [Dendronalium phyllosphericum]